MLNSRRTGGITGLVALAGVGFGVAACAGTSGTTSAGPGTSSVVVSTSVVTTTVPATSASSASDASPAGSHAPSKSASAPASSKSGAGNAPTGASDLKAFVGTWTGHTRTLTIGANGVATEKVYDGCCTVAWTLTFSVDHASGTHADGSLYATLLSATFAENPDFPTPGSPEPQKGQGGIAGVQDGVFSDPFTGGTFCDAAAETAGKCGL